MNGENFLTVGQISKRMKISGQTAQILESELGEQKTLAEIEAEIEADFQPEPKPEPEQSAPVSARRGLPKWIRPALD